MITCQFCNSQLKCEFENAVLAKNIPCSNCSSEETSIEVLYLIANLKQPTIMSCMVAFANYQVDIFPNNEEIDVYLLSWQHWSKPDRISFRMPIPKFSSLKEFYEITNTRVKKILKNKVFL